MKSYIKILLVGLLSVYLVGCSSLKTVEQTAPKISVQKNAGPLVIAVLDQRPYVLNKDKSPAFEGLMRSNFGIPYSYNTATREPMSLYLGKRLAHGFKTAGVVAELYPTSLDVTKGVLLEKLGQDGEKSLIVSFSEWKYDHHTFTKSAFYNADIIVLDKEGNTLVNKNFAGKDAIPSGVIANAMQEVYKARFEAIFADNEVRQALEH